MIHERNIDGPVCHELVTGDSELDLTANDGETVTIIMRCGDADDIVACGLFEVSVGLAEELGAVLVPRCTHNLMIDQCDAALVDRATDRALARTTGELIVNQEALR